MDEVQKLSDALPEPDHDEPKFHVEVCQNSFRYDRNVVHLYMEFVHLFTNIIHSKKGFSMMRFYKFCLPILCMRNCNLNSAMISGICSRHSYNIFRYFNVILYILALPSRELSGTMFTSS